MKVRLFQIDLSLQSRERVLLPRGMKGLVSVYLSVSVVSIFTAYNGT